MKLMKMHWPLYWQVISKLGIGLPPRSSRGGGLGRSIVLLMTAMDRSWLLWYTGTLGVFGVRQLILSIILEKPMNHNDIVSILRGGFAVGDIVIAIRIMRSRNKVIVNPGDVGVVDRVLDNGCCVVLFTMELNYPGFEPYVTTIYAPIDRYLRYYYKD